MAAPLTGTSRTTLLLTLRGTGAGLVVTAVVNLVVIPIVLHRVGAATFGAWATIASVIAIGALADAGVRTEVIRRVSAALGADDRETMLYSVRAGTTLIVVIAACMLAVVSALAPLIRLFIFPGGVPGYGPIELDWIIRATAATLAVSLIANGYFGVLRGVQRGDVDGVAVMIAVTVNAAVTISCVYAGLGLWALFAGSAGQVVAQSGWRWVMARRLIPDLRFRLVALQPAAARGYLVLSGLALLAQVGDVVDSQWDKIVLSRFVGPAAVASFQVGTLLVLQAKEVSILPLVPLLAAVSELRRSDPERMARTYRLLSRWAFTLSAITLGGLFLFGPAFVHLWLGDQVPLAGRAVRLFGVAVAINVVGAPLAMRAFGEGWHPLAAASAVTNMLVNGSASFALTMAIGFDGALYGSIIGNAAGTLVLIVSMWRRLGARMTWPWPRALSAAVAVDALCIAVGLDTVGSWPLLILAVGAYAPLVGILCVVAEGIQLRLPGHRARP